ncbi:phage tail-collar fiber domain-containing protein [Clostridium novyi]
MAEQQFYTLITNVGQAKLANATALGTKVNFVKVQVGDGRDYNPNEAQESLKHKVWEGNINNITIDSKNPNWIVIQTLIPASVGGFNISEVGVFDDEGNMLIVSKYPETYKPKLENGSGKDLTIKLVIQVSNTENVTLKIDPSITIATKEDIRSVEKQIGNIKVPVQSVNSKTGAVELKAEDIKTKDGTNLEKFKENVTTQYEETKNNYKYLGINLLKNSDFAQDLKYWVKDDTSSLNESISIKKEQNFNSVNIISYESKKYGIYQNVIIEPNQTYTISFYAKKYNGNRTTLKVGIDKTDIKEIAIDSTDYKRYSVNVKTSSELAGDELGILFFPVRNTDKAYYEISLHHLKMQKGYIVTDWTPALTDDRDLINIQDKRLDVIEQALIEKGILEAKKIIK